MNIKRSLRKAFKDAWRAFEKEMGRRPTEEERRAKRHKVFQAFMAADLSRHYPKIREV